MKDNGEVCRLTDISTGKNNFLYIKQNKPTKTILGEFVLIKKVVAKSTDRKSVV